MSKFHYYLTYMILFTGLFAAITTVHAAVQAKLDRSQIEEDQTVRLIIESDDAQHQGQPDLSVLNNKFNVLGTSSSQNIAIVNGQQTTLIRWVTELEPKAVGSFSIPPITVGNQKTRGLRLTVLPQSQSNADNSRDIFVENALSPQQVYVQQQSILTIKLYLGVNILDGNLSDPSIEDTQVLRLSNDVQYETSIDGRQYRVIERKYALFPNASGNIQMPGIQFSGTIEDTSVQNNGVFGNLFNQGKRVRAKANDLSLEVIPPATAFSGKYWLPAKQLEIEDLSLINQELVVGQPITRRIQIRAVGLSAEQLPEIEHQSSDNFRQYPDKVSFNTGQKDGNVIGEATRNVAIIANKEGQLMLPEIALNWWNTEINSMQTAILPQKLFSVISDSAAGTSKTQSHNITTDTQPISETASSILTSTTNTLSTATSNWLWIAIALALGWLLTSVYFIKRIRSQTNSNNDDYKDKSLKTSQALKQLKSACKSNDPIATRYSIIRWSKSIWPNERTLSLTEIATRLNNPTISKQLNALDQTLYSSQSTMQKDNSILSWSGMALFSLLENYTIQSLAKDSKPVKALPRLYPERATA